jgi:hypothetical protein
MPDPEFDACFGIIILQFVAIRNKKEVACVDVCGFAEQQQMVHELPSRLQGLWVILQFTLDMQARGELPEMTPAPGEHARPHDRIRWRISSGRSLRRSPTEAGGEAPLPFLPLLLGGIVSNKALALASCSVGCAHLQAQSCPICLRKPEAST